MNEKSKIFDVDQHLCDTNVDFSAYMTNVGVEDLPKNVEFEGQNRLLLGGKLFPKPAGLGRGSHSGSAAGGELSWDKRIQSLEEHNIGHALLLPGNVGMAIHAIEDRNLRANIASGYRKWQLEDWEEHSDERFSVALLTDSQCIPTKAEMSHRAVKSLMMRPADARNSRFDSDEMNQLYVRACDAGLPIVLHSSTGYHQQSAVADRYDNYFFTHLYSHIIEMQIALGEILSSGVLERHPQLRFVFAEAGIWWVPGFIERIYWHMEKFSSLIRGNAADLKSLVQQRCLFCCQIEDVNGIGALIQNNHWMKVAIGTDLPHWDAIEPSAILEKLSHSNSKSVSWNNAASFFKMNENA